MAVNLSPLGGVAGQFLDNNGVILSGGKIYTYTAGTTTPQATYTSASGATAHTNPIILDSSGRVPGGEIWLTDGLQYKFVIKTSAEILIGTYDNITGINSNFVNYTNQEEIQTATAGQTVFTLTTMQYQPGTGSLSAFVDGVNQYDGVSYAFVETDSTTVTFTDGLHVGALVKFTTSAINASSYGDAFQISYTPPFTDSVPTNVGDKLAQTVSVKDFGAVGDGVTDDTTAIQAAIDYIKADGGMLNVPTGTYITAQINIGGGVKAWSMIGEGQESTIFKHLDGDDTLFFGASSVFGFTLQSFTVDCMFSEYSHPNANHGVVIENTSQVKIKEVTVKNYKNSAILLYSLTSGLYKQCLIEDCSALGLNASANGFLMVNMWESGYVRCTASGAVNSPGYGIQLKNDCRYCYITDCYSEGNRAGFGFGQDSTIGSEYNTCVNLRAVKNTIYGFVMGYANNNSIDNLYVDCDNLSGATGVSIDFTSSGNKVNAIVENIAANRSAVLFAGTPSPSDNYVDLSYIKNIDAAGYAATFSGVSANNTVTLKRSNTPALPATGRTYDFVAWNSNTTNRFEFDPYPASELVVISSGVATIVNAATECLILDTESGAATDDLDSITGDLTNGRILYVSTIANARDVTVKNGTGNILLDNTVDKTLAHTTRTLTLRYNAITSQWVEVAYSAPI